MPLLNAYALLLAAIFLEVFSTMGLKLTVNFTRPLPTILVLGGYALSFYLLTYVLRAIPVGITYAVWSGVGMVAVAFLSWIYFKQHLDLPALLGIGLILAGVLVINLCSKSVTAH